MEKFIEKADILIEALPYIKRFYNKTIVIKYGGRAMINENLKKLFAMDVVLMKYIGINPVIVHGGGPQIDEMMKRMGKNSRFIDGMRITDDESMEIVEMVLVGKVNKEVVSLINKEGGRAIGLSGKDGGLIIAKRVKNKEMGRVGEIESIDPSSIEIIKNGKFIPVIAPVAVDSNGEAYNINADIVAGGLASSLNAEKLIILTDIEGILDKNNRLISSISQSMAVKYINDGIIHGGMIPKIMCSLEAIKNGVKKVHIIDGRIKHAILLEIFTDKGIGTEIYRDEEVN
jgi:acetylglutamate kinase